MKLRPRWIVYGLVGLAVAVPLAAVLVAWSGVYNVAASSGHLRITDIFLRFGMEHSVRARAPNVTPPALDNPDLIRLGAGHFHSGCAYCHGAPGIAIPASARHMLPPPPDLKNRVGEWSDQELFWIVKHGIKYAGMPAWPTQQRDDEVWTLVAFLRALPALDPAGYRALAFGDLRLVPPTGAELATGRAVTDPVGACARCHGAEDRLPTSGLAPRLHGQPAEMLLSALEAYAKGDRKSGIMQQIAAELNPDARGKLSTYYAGLPPPAAQTVAPNGSVLVERGRNLAMKGDPAARIPACEGCHGPAALPAYPRLAGQNAPYIAGQLRLWQRGDRGNTALNAIMEPIARRLGEHQINEVAAYYAGVPAGTAAALPPPVQKAGQP